MAFVGVASAVEKIENLVPTHSFSRTIQSLEAWR
jgi:hypothetical protein